MFAGNEVKQVHDRLFRIDDFFENQIVRTSVTEVIFQPWNNFNVDLYFRLSSEEIVKYDWKESPGLSVCWLK